MGRSIVIPEEHLVQVSVIVGKPKLPPMPYRGTYGLDDSQKAEFYYEEALGKLALARYYMEKSASN